MFVRHQEFWVGHAQSHDESKMGCIWCLRYFCPGKTRSTNHDKADIAIDACLVATGICSFVCLSASEEILVSYECKMRRKRRAHRLNHLLVEIVALTRALSNSSEDGETTWTQHACPSPFDSEQQQPRHASRDCTDIPFRPYEKDMVSGQAQSAH